MSGAPPSLMKLAPLKESQGVRKGFLNKAKNCPDVIYLFGPLREDIENSPGMKAGKLWRENLLRQRRPWTLAYQRTLLFSLYSSTNRTRVSSIYFNTNENIFTDIIGPYEKFSSSLSWRQSRVEVRGIEKITCWKAV